jgi:hypothetical protein
MDPSQGPLVDCENYTSRLYDRCEIFPDTPRPLGECGAVRVRKIRLKNGVDPDEPHHCDNCPDNCDETSDDLEPGDSLEVDLLVCIGGRYKIDEDVEIKLPDGTTKNIKKTSFVFHEKPWVLNLKKPSIGWRNDLLPPIPTPRFNAAVSEVVTMEERIIDEETGEKTNQTRKVDRVFVIGGRTEKGLTASIEALNLTDRKWETGWPGLDGQIPEKKEDKK